MKKKALILLLCLLPILGCEQMEDDPDNAIVTGVVYRHVVFTDSIFQCQDSIWVYTDWYYTDPAESVQVWVESDEMSGVPYIGPDVMGYTDSEGIYRIPIYLGHTYGTFSGDVYNELSEDFTGYTYKYYADVRVFCLYKGGWFYDFGGGLTLKAGEEFILFPVCLDWYVSQGD
ncbi:hypothetical protein KAT73_01700 [candidate division WOR-3 bacterium]|nr:hypothetical protein [candidate division WOR-3 bacterium]